MGRSHGNGLKILFLDLKLFKPLQVWGFICGQVRLIAFLLFKKQRDFRKGTTALDECIYARMKFFQYGKTVQSRSFPFPITYPFLGKLWLLIVHFHFFTSISLIFKVKQRQTARSQTSFK